MSFAHLILYTVDPRDMFCWLHSCFSGSFASEANLSFSRSEYCPEDTNFPSCYSILQPRWPNLKVAKCSESHRHCAEHGLQETECHSFSRCILEKPEIYN
jgi:hypothetical protein